MADLKHGTIGLMARNGKNFTLTEDNDTWYSAWEASSLNGATKGADVEFSYVTKPGKDGRMYNNIRGSVRVVNPGSGEVATGNNVIDSATNQPNKTFGSVSLNTGRSIARQNAMNVVATMFNNDLSWVIESIRDREDNDQIEVENVVDLAIALARRIEEYTTGDLDKAIVEEELKQEVKDEVTADNVQELYDNAS